MRTLPTERLRVPRQCQSAAGKSGPKEKPKGVSDGQWVNIPILACEAMWRRRSDSSATGRKWSLKGVGKSETGKSVLDAETKQYLEASAEGIESVNRLPRKSAKHIYMVPVPQTDTGSRGENPKVLERFTAKELGKIIL